jgi:aminoglycoside phosphotransferase (APT) family kinase protein
MDTPAADIAVDEPLVRRLLGSQHPDLAQLTLDLVANGWDNVLYRLGDDLVVRLPRRLVAAELVEHEQRWLPEIALRVSVEVPAPVRVGLPSPQFPYPWSIAAWLEGDLASESGSTGFAADLARFVRELHTDAPADAPINPVRGVPLRARDDALRARLASGALPNSGELERLWDRALAAPAWERPPRWLHGDLHPANMLLREGRLAAVLDFGDVCGGDPATDLATAWLSFDPSGRALFRDALDYDDATWRRASGWALLLGTALATNSADNPAMRRIGEHALDQVLLDNS